MYICINCPYATYYMEQVKNCQVGGFPKPNPIYEEVSQGYGHSTTETRYPP